MITQKNKCIDECKNDNDNKYIFECISGCDSQYVEKCPNDLKTDYEEKKCLISCTVNKFEYMNTCLTDCPSWTYKIYTDRNLFNFIYFYKILLDVLKNFPKITISIVLQEYIKYVMKIVKDVVHMEIIIIIIVMNVKMAIFFLMSL